MSGKQGSTSTAEGVDAPVLRPVVATSAAGFGARKAHHAELEAVLAESFVAKRTRDTLVLLKAAGVPCAPSGCRGSTC